MKPAEKLAKALDAENYTAARKLLDADCTYKIRGKIIEGADAVIESYQKNGEEGRTRWDDLIFKSEVTSTGDNQARIDYTDVIIHGEDAHAHRCAQEIVWNKAGKITKITHIDLPGELKALNAFKKANPSES